MRLFIASIKAGECEREEGWKMEDRARDGAAAGSAFREAVVCYQKRIERHTNQSRKATSGGINSLTHTCGTRHTVACK